MPAIDVLSLPRDGMFRGVPYRMLKNDPRVPDDTYGLLANGQILTYAQSEQNPRVISGGADGRVQFQDRYGRKKKNVYIFDVWAWAWPELANVGHHYTQYPFHTPEPEPEPEPAPEPEPKPEPAPVTPGVLTLHDLGPMIYIVVNARFKAYLKLADAQTCVGKLNQRRTDCDWQVVAVYESQLPREMIPDATPQQPYLFG